RLDLNVGTAYRALSTRCDMQQQQGGSFRRDINQMIAIFQMASLQMEAWFRLPGTPGSRYFGFHAYLGWIAFFVIACLFRSPLLVQFALCTGVAIVVHKVAHSIRRYFGYRCHSMYVGTSLFRGILRADPTGEKKPPV